jgi:hypothetical protein
MENMEDIEKIEEDDEGKNETESQIFKEEKEKNEVKDKSAGYEKILPDLIKTFNENFPTSTSLIILLGYIAIACFGEDLNQYLIFILFLGVIYYILKNKEICLSKFLNFIKSSRFFMGSLLFLCTYLILRFQESLLLTGVNVYNFLFNLITKVFKF